MSGFAILLPELVQIIFNQLDFLGQVNFRLVSKFFATNYPITNLNEIHHKITNKFLQLYPSCTNLHIGYPESSPNLNRMTNLITLHARFCYKLTNNDISNLTNLTKLYIGYNGKINNINHMTNLLELDVTYSNISDVSITKLINLTKLNTSDNCRITNVNHLTNLQTLIASGYDCGIDNNGISQLTNLTHLDITRNNKINEISHLHNLHILRCGPANTIKTLNKLPESTKVFLY
jgi:hypothetical protein